MAAGSPLSARSSDFSSKRLSAISWRRRVRTARTLSVTAACPSRSASACISGSRKTSSVDGSLRNKTEFWVADTEQIMTQAERTRVSAPHGLERVHVDEQVLDLLIGHDLAEAFHFAAPVLDDVADAGVVGRQSAQGQVLLLEDALQAGALLSTRGVGFVAAIAVIVVELSARTLLRIQSEFSVGFTALSVASGEGTQPE